MIDLVVSQVSANTTTDITYIRTNSIQISEDLLAGSTIFSIFQRNFCLFMYFLSI